MLDLVEDDGVDQVTLILHLLHHPLNLLILLLNIKHFNIDRHVAVYIGFVVDENLVLPIVRSWGKVRWMQVLLLLPCQAQVLYLLDRILLEQLGRIWKHLAELEQSLFVERVELRMLSRALLCGLLIVGV